MFAARKWGGYRNTSKKILRITFSEEVFIGQENFCF